MLLVSRYIGNFCRGLINEPEERLTNNLDGEKGTALIRSLRNQQKDDGHREAPIKF